MITIITGLPGNGKTLYALSYIKAYSEKESRDVYYSGITDLKLPWTEFKPEEWLSLPNGSIIVIDEAQFVFPKRPNGSKLPDFYEKLATHRHKGFDIFLITQHPSLVDNFVRQLVGRHLHAIRKFGFARATIYEWSSANVSPQNAASHKNAITHKWKFPKAAYEYYKSAEVHTVKRGIPMQIILACFVIVAVIGLAIFVFHRFQQRTVKHEQDASVGAAGTGAPAANGGAANGALKASYTNALADARQYMFERTPRIAGLPQTAPRYDEITKPTTAPVPSSCIANQKKCSCFTQQATPMDVPDLLCRDIVARGYFVDFDDKGGHNQQQTASNSRADGVVLASAEKSSGGPSVVVLDEDGYGVLGKKIGAQK
ncbi:zonular occludens toxin domain-containing protein [Paraherbaspirillum soli]|uniref:Zonular occludens toxin domain-containing protein n=1 Tax=Paraherbaspirillum soli TaxID=631222 RepID=A0ABW0MDI6_9BURK